VLLFCVEGTRRPSTRVKGAFLGMDLVTKVKRPTLYSHDGPVVACLASLLILDLDRSLEATLKRVWRFFKKDASCVARPLPLSSNIQWTSTGA
jgi:hypothetical protein